MAVVSLSEVYNPLTFGRRTQEAQTRLNRFIASGIVVADPQMQAQLATGGNIGELTQFNPLTVDEPNYSNDVPGDTTTPSNIANKTMRFRSAQRNKSWSTMDLARELALEDPVGAITGRVGHYWAADDEKRLINSCLGVLADNVANDGGDMQINVATDLVAAVTDDERIGGERVIDAMQTLGDHKNSLTVLAIHSQIHARLQKQQLITYVRDADNNIMFETYLGKRLIVDDSLPAVAGTNRITYTCIMFGPGVFGRANGKVLVPSEIEREASAGNGGGQDIMHSRVHNAFHPLGFSFLSGSVAGQSATYAELAAAANWDRKVDRKLIPMVFIKVND